MEEEENYSITQLQLMIQQLTIRLDNSFGYINQIKQQTKIGITINNNDNIQITEQFSKDIIDTATKIAKIIKHLDEIKLSEKAQLELIEDLSKKNEALSEQLEHKITSITKIQSTLNTISTTLVNEHL
ncbi:hypothetical protein WA158_000248 [Blastocystis sp. Blastoise]